MIYNPFLRNLIFALTSDNAERAHRFTVDHLKQIQVIPGALKAIEAALAVRDPRLVQFVAGIRFPNPFGVAAGLDKNAECVEMWQALGFGSVEIGTVTPMAQSGNQEPRLFRIPTERALVNRMGFNNHGRSEIAKNLAAMRERGRVTIPVGASIGKQMATKVDDLDSVIYDHTQCVKALKPFVDWFTFNPSSPNTTGLRSLQTREGIRRLVGPIKDAAGKIPVFMKLAPDLSDGDYQECVEGGIEGGADGVVASNTAIAFSLFPELIGKRNADEKGGKSGPFLKRHGLKRVALTRQFVGNRDFAVIGVGGIHSPRDAAEYLMTGADLTQVYTGFVWQGPRFPSRVNRALADLMHERHCMDLRDFRRIRDLPSHF